MGKEAEELKSIMINNYSSLRKVLEKQDEASFKAGKKEGIREVVEWIEYNACHDSRGNTLQEIAIDKQLIIDVPLWQIKLNEWGIKR